MITRRPLWITCLVALALAPANPVHAQMNMAGHVMEMRDETPPDQLPVPQRISGIGNAHLLITAKPESQRWFDQGLNLLHDFWDYESARAFEQSIRIDPECAICYWGLYEAEAFYHSTAQGYASQALAKAVSLKDRGSARERLYIEATEAQKQGSHEPSLNLWRKLVRDYPDEIQAKIFLAQAARDQQSLEILRSILLANPDDSAANHYLVHALEATDHPEQALASAERLARLAPSSGHMVHMPGHIFFRVGDYARAEQSFADSMLVDEQYMRQQHVDPDNDWNYVHNLMYAVANLLEEGKLQAAISLSSKLRGARGQLESTLYTYSTRDSMTRLHPQLPVALRTGDWEQVVSLLQSSQPPADLPNPDRPNLEFLAQQLIRFANGMEAVEARQKAIAQEYSTQFDAELSRRSQSDPGVSAPPVTASTKPPKQPPQLSVLPDALLPPLLRTMKVMSLELRASVAASQGKAAEATLLFTQAADQEKALGYREPPSYIRPVEESEGAILLARGETKQAKAAFQRALLKRPRSGFALYGIARSMEQDSSHPVAVAEYAEFLAAWKDADPNLPQLVRAHSYLSHHGAL